MLGLSLASHISLPSPPILASFRNRPNEFRKMFPTTAASNLPNSSKSVIAYLGG